MNTIIAGVGGAIGAAGFQNLWLHLMEKAEDKHAQGIDFVDEDKDQGRRKSFENLRKKTNFINTASRIDTFLINRGILCGMISVCVSPSSFYAITALVNGALAGILYIVSLKVYHIVKLDDAMHVSQVHGLMSLYALLSICFFHKEEGFFFKDIYLSYIESDSDQVAPIILSLGSNSLSCAVTVALSTFLAFVCFRLIMERFMRVSKVQEIIGQDTYQLFAKGDRILRNHLYGIINEFYPENTGEIAVKR